jgi:hypothetical protein
MYQVFNDRESIREGKLGRGDFDFLVAKEIK